MSEIAKKYIALYDDLLSIVMVSEARAITGEDELIKDHVNFFVKSYLIMCCTYLESYAKEMAENCIREYNSKICQLAIPHNLLLWSLSPNDIKKKERSFGLYQINIDSKEIDKYVSANPNRISELFELMGFDFSVNASLTAAKSSLYPVVAKRNNIVHYNDEASDVTFSDVKNYISQFRLYLKEIDAFVNPAT